MAAGYIAAMGTPHALTTGAKTVIMAIAGANSGLVVVEMGISFDGITSSAVPAVVEMVSSTQAGAGTATDTITVVQTHGRVTGGEAPTSSARYSAEPTVLVRHRVWYVPQFMSGPFIVQFPLGREPETDDSGGSIRGYGIRVNVSAVVNCLAYLELEHAGLEMPRLVGAS
jgi:hypothetical protein